jgi:hypothetical protein
MKTLQRKIQKSLSDGIMPRQGMQPLARKILNGIKSHNANSVNSTNSANTYQETKTEVPHPAA